METATATIPDPSPTQITGLTHWGKMCLDSLRDNRPTLYAQMVADGSLKTFLTSRQKQAERAVVTMIGQGVGAMQAQGEAIRQYILIPDEEEYPDIQQGPTEN